MEGRDMKKKLVGVLLIITGIIGITACGNNDQGVSEKKKAKLSESGHHQGLIVNYF